jgi:hypothetical protein
MTTENALQEGTRPAEVRDFATMLVAFRATFLRRSPHPSSHLAD